MPLAEVGQPAAGGFAVQAGLMWKVRSSSMIQRKSPVLKAPPVRIVLVAPSTSFTAMPVCAGKVSVTVAAAVLTVFCEFCALKVKVRVHGAVVQIASDALKPPFASTVSANPAPGITLAALTVSG